MRLADAIEESHPVRRDDGRDQVPRHVPDLDTQSEIDLIRYHRFMHDEGRPREMRHLEVIRYHRNRTCHTSPWAWKAQYGFNKVNQDLGK